MLKLGFIGAGTVGNALSLLLSNKGYPVVAVSSRSQTSARNLAEVISSCQVLNNQGVADTAELVFITTPDDTIASASKIKWHRLCSLPTENLVFRLFQLLKPRGE